MFQWIHFAFKDWIYSLTIGFLVVSYWRGSWTLLDILGCQQPPEATLANGDSFCFALDAAENPQGPMATLRLQNATISYGVGISLLLVGVTMVWAGLWLPDHKRLEVTFSIGMTRLAIVYILGAAAVCMWRGIWYWTDAWIVFKNNDPLMSYWFTSLVGAGVAYLFYCGNSILAPPASFLLDGPDTDAPPIAVTALGSHFAVTLPAGKPRPRFPIYVDLLDLMVSFGLVPFAVVWYWRGSWMVLDYYFWGFTDSDRDVQLSMLWSIIMFGLCIWLTSEPIVGILDRKFRPNMFLLGMLSRLRTYVVAWGTVSFWRCIWYFWDEFLGGTTLLSASLGHVLSLLLLTAMGCVSSINAPASTLGVDSIPHPECDDEPLFSMVPLPWEILYAFALFRQVDKTKVDSVKCAAIEASLRAALAMGEIEMSNTGRDEGVVDASEGQDDDIIQAPMDDAEQEQSVAAIQRSWHSWRPGLVRSRSYLDIMKPGLRLRMCTDYAQRPNIENARERSRIFRNR